MLAELSSLAEVNDRDGYAAGDALIQEAGRAAQRMASRCGGTACRHSGARLAIVVPDTHAEGAEALARELRLDLDGRSVAVTTGVAGWHHGESGADVLTRARLALVVHEIRPG